MEQKSNQMFIPKSVWTAVLGETGRKDSVLIHSVAADAFLYASLRPWNKST